MDVVASAGKQDFEAYFNAKLQNKIGMEGYWNNGLIFDIYHSNTRSMARFGLLAQNKGKWQNEQIIPEDFLKQALIFPIHKSILWFSLVAEWQVKFYGTGWTDHVYRTIDSQRSF